MTPIFLTTDISQAKTAASKARIDVLAILKSEKYQQLYLPRKMSIGNIIAFSKKLWSMAKGDTHVIIEYPCWQKKRMYLVYFLCKLKGIKLYAIIHDVNSLRFQTSPKKDLIILNLFDGLIAHNESMAGWLRSKGFKKKIVNLNAFDYLLENSGFFHEQSVKDPIRLFYAGNLAYNKATYIYDQGLSSMDKVQLCVYGQDFDKDKIAANGSKVLYKGLFDPSTPNLPENYHFGLIWEGTNLKTCDGAMGEYIRYNNPHKFSLYMALGLPIIVWKDAAIASFITEHQIGFTISNFDELESVAEKITDEEYRSYVNNIDKLSKKVRNGYFLKTALNQLVKS